MTSFVAKIWRDSVKDSDELERVLTLPRRPPLALDSPEAEALVEKWTLALCRGSRACACRGDHLDRLLPAQAWLLEEAAALGGVVGSIVAGGGKTVADILAPLVVPDVRRAVLLVPPGLVEQLGREWRRVREHFVVPTLVLEKKWRLEGDGPVEVTVLPYSLLSRPDFATVMSRLSPDLVIADEAHCLKRREAARTGRVLRHLVASGARLCAWSGTLTSKSIKDFAHLLAFALGDKSPLPLDPDEVERWAEAVDPSDWPARPGALRRLCAGEETAREGVARRVVESAGVVTTTGGALPGASLTVRELRLAVPADVREAVAQVRKTWCRPDGEELTRILEVAECVDQLWDGFYYRWRFPGDPPAALVERWFGARSRWLRCVRDVLRAPRDGRDTPFLVEESVRRGEVEWAEGALAEWDAVKDAVEHETETVWLDDFVARAASEWAWEAPGVVWCDHRATGLRVASLTGLRYWDGDDDLALERGDRSVVVSIAAHGTGWDGLQRVFSRQLVVDPPADGATWEQLLARLHRVGQSADVVETWVCRHAPERRDALDRAVELAKYCRTMSQRDQRLLVADVEWDTRGETA